MRVSVTPARPKSRRERRQLSRESATSGASFHPVETSGAPRIETSGAPTIDMRGAPTTQQRPSAQRRVSHYVRQRARGCCGAGPPWWQRGRETLRAPTDGSLGPTERFQGFPPWWPMGRRRRRDTLCAPMDDILGPIKRHYEPPLRWPGKGLMRWRETLQALIDDIRSPIRGVRRDIRSPIVGVRRHRGGGALSRWSWPTTRYHARPFVGVFKSQFTTDLSIFDNNIPQNGSKNEETAPRTRTGYPHEGPSVELRQCLGPS